MTLRACAPREALPAATTLRTEWDTREIIRELWSCGHVSDAQRDEMLAACRETPESSPADYDPGFIGTLDHWTNRVTRACGYDAAVLAGYVTDPVAYATLRIRHAEAIGKPLKYVSAPCD